MRNDLEVVTLLSLLGAVLVVLALHLISAASDENAIDNSVPATEQGEGQRTE
jgi:uncharacterized membrane protein